MHPNDTALNDYVDGSLGPAERAASTSTWPPARRAGRRSRTCARSCARAATLELREPPVRAWSRLERAIELEHAPPATRAGPPEPAPAATRRHRAAAWTLARGGGGARARRRSSALRYASIGARLPTRAGERRGGIGARATRAQSIETELRQAEAHYDNAIKGLEAIANSEQSALDPRTAATLQKNLAVIDQAISESRAAVRSQPASEPAQQSLIEGFKTKIGAAAGHRGADQRNAKRQRGRGGAHRLRAQSKRATDMRLTAPFVIAGLAHRRRCRPRAQDGAARGSCFAT